MVPDWGGRVGKNKKTVLRIDLQPISNSLATKPSQSQVAEVLKISRASHLRLKRNDDAFDATIIKQS